MANRRPGSTPVSAAVSALAFAVAVAVTAGCGAADSTPVTHRVRVSARSFALAEVARRVGLDRVVVSDRGDVALSTGGDPDPWLDPVAMMAVTDGVAAALSEADPAGAGAYRDAARVFRAQLRALDIDYRSSLADCARHDIVTADKALVRTGARYNFVDHAATDAGVVDLVRAKGITVVFTEPDVALAPVQVLAHAVGARVDQMDTMTVRTAAEAARNASYVSLMTNNLAKLRTGLACASGSSS